MKGNATILRGKALKIVTSGLIKLSLQTVSFVLILSFSVWAGTTVTIGTDPSKYVLQGKIVTPNEVIDGKLVVDGDTIACVSADCPTPEGATLFKITGAYVYPGFIDAHNHVAYNFLPKWTPPKLYQNRGQWQSSQSYKDFKKPYNDLKDKKKLFCEMVKYGEIKALLSGVTTIQGTSPGSKCVAVLIRNAENQNNLNLPSSRIRTYILDIKGFKSSVDWDKTKAYVFHIGEGIDEKSRKEFDTLTQKGLLKEQTVIIHGTAFTAAEFEKMGHVGAKLIWSPQSNLVLYGQTTDIKTALEKKVPVSIGVDWNPSGSDNMFDELRVAAQVNKDKFENAIPDSAWLKMITENPAKALSLDPYIGRLVQGLKADIVVVESKDPDPSESLLKNHLQDVDMVWVGGNLLYANGAILEKIKPGQCEPLQVYGSDKRVCVKDTKATVPKAAQTLSQIQAVLQANYSNLAPLTP